VVHCLGILTSIFSAVVVSRGLVNLVYGSRRKLAGLSIGQVWRPAGDSPAAGKTLDTPPDAKLDARLNAK
jgi:preprotein translocase subunit SecD